MVESQRYAMRFMEVESEWKRHVRVKSQEKVGREYCGWDIPVSSDKAGKGQTCR